jgi:hypothetical protein
MVGERQIDQDALSYKFSLERHVPETHLLRAIDRFVVRRCRPGSGVSSAALQRPGALRSIPSC